MKRALRHSGQKQTLEHYKDVPSVINERFEKRRVNAAYISSIKARRCKKPKLGIVAKKEVKSVIVIQKNTQLPDSESATSNVLAQVLGIKGEVLIGDKALRYALNNDDYVDLSKVWSERYKLPFVFALLCYHNKTPLLIKIEKGFYRVATNTKIPFYLLVKAAKRVQIQPKELLDYLSLISYEIDHKSINSLKLFYKKAKSKNL